MTFWALRVTCNAVVLERGSLGTFTAYGRVLSVVRACGSRTVEVDASAAPIVPEALDLEG